MFEENEEVGYELFFNCKVVPCTILACYTSNGFFNYDIKDDCDTEITTNGSLISTDDFATSIRKNTKASQALIIYGEDVCTYKIVLN